MGSGISWLLDVNIKSFFDTLDRGKLREIIGQRVRDGVVTRLIPFARPRKGSGKQEPAEPSTFDFLGFTDYWGKTRKGGFVVRRKTARKRIRRSLKAIRQWMPKNRHLRVGEQWKALVQKLRGHFGCYGITGNGNQLERFREEVKRLWHKWLDRRSRKHGGMSWQRFSELMRRFPFPPATVVHSIYAAKS
jgi:hypothetical protein